MQFLTRIVKSEIAGADGHDSLVESGIVYDSKGNIIATFIRNGDGTIGLALPAGAVISVGGVPVGGGNPFDQDLNTTDAPIFAGLTATDFITALNGVRSDTGPLYLDAPLDDVIFRLTGFAEFLRIVKATGNLQLAAGDLVIPDAKTLRNASNVDLLAAKVPTSRTVNGHALSSDVTVSKSDVGLGSVDNTSDAGKPVSTAQQTALNLKASISAETSGMPTTPGNYPNRSFPVAYTNNSASGHNDLYTVPAGRKAIWIDYLVTNSTVGAIGHNPEIKISGTYYSIGTTVSESAGGLGHNYAPHGSTRFSQTILLNAGESFSVKTDAVGLTIWPNIIEFDDSSPLNRASLSSWSSGDNTLFTVPAGKTIYIGSLAPNSLANLPSIALAGITYFNVSGSTRTMGKINIVPSGGSVGATNQFAGSNSVLNNSGFSKYFHGCLGAGDFISINTDANTAGQFAWINYVLA